MTEDREIAVLHERIATLEEELNACKGSHFHPEPTRPTFLAPDEISPLFQAAQTTVNDYFSRFKTNPEEASVEVSGERYVLLRASALSYDFLSTIQSLYQDRGPEEALAIGKDLLFDLSHVIGMNDAASFHEKMGLTDPIEKLSAGPVHFAYTGWAFVELLAESRPSPDENFFLIYNHPFSFEADSWLKVGKKSDVPICIMNSGYSSGWSEQSYSMPLTAVEVSCRAKGDEHCRFIMAPPDQIERHLDQYFELSPKKKGNYQIPTFFERKTLEENLTLAKKQAEESAELKSLFVANMSHEIRTPLNGIVGMTNLLRETALTDEQKELTDTISQCTKSLLRIVNDVLDFSKIESGTLTLRAEAFSISDLVGSLLSLCCENAKYKQIKLEVDIAPELPRMLVGDQGRIRQVLLNLLDNAIKFTPEGGRVSVEISPHRKATGRVLFAVKDSGIGVSESAKEKIFQAFSQEDVSNSREYSGTGLGLSISAQLVELMGGKLELESTQGKGATFYFSMPFQQHRGEYQPSSTRTFIGLRVLLVEDNLMNQRLIASLLESKGMLVSKASGGHEAIELCKVESYDLILMDIQMPKMTGIEACEVIKKLLGTSCPPIVAVTAHNLDSGDEKLRAWNMDAYVSKPIDKAILFETILRLVER